MGAVADFRDVPARQLHAVRAGPLALQLHPLPRRRRSNVRARLHLGLQLRRASLCPPAQRLPVLSHPPLPHPAGLHARHLPVAHLLQHGGAEDDLVRHGPALAAGWQRPRARLPRHHHHRAADVPVADVRVPAGRVLRAAALLVLPLLPAPLHRRAHRQLQRLRLPSQHAPDDLQPLHAGQVRGAAGHQRAVPRDADAHHPRQLPRLQRPLARGRAHLQRARHHLLLGAELHVAEVPGGVAVLPAVGAAGRRREPGEHRALRQQQLRHRGLLEELALLLQPLAGAVHVHSAGGVAAEGAKHLGHLHLRRPLARPQRAPPHVGLAQLLLRGARDPRQVDCKVPGGAAVEGDVAVPAHVRGVRGGEHLPADDGQPRGLRGGHRRRARVRQPDGHARRRRLLPLHVRLLLLPRADPVRGAGRGGARSDEGAEGGGGGSDAGARSSRPQLQVHVTRRRDWERGLAVVHAHIGGTVIPVYIAGTKCRIPRAVARETGAPSWTGLPSIWASGTSTQGVRGSVDFIGCIDAGTTQTKHNRNGEHFV
mmetsp:Transcript_26877/g.58610  ORF Transcript_26877/g.58610 Transcript_26877/m.58610 type:complete len:539 (-) Transcript_26877:1566-3182(-)